jgi:hypothetical protein
MRFMNRYAAANGMGYQDKWEDRTENYELWIMNWGGVRINKNNLLTTDSSILIAQNQLK